MKTKKITAVLLALAMMSVVACNNSSSDDSNKETGKSETVVSGTIDVSEDVTVTTENDDESEETGENTFSEMTVVDNDKCSIKITGIDPDNTRGYTLYVALENKSADKSYMYSVNSITVNGVECESMFSSTVAPGKKANGEINLLTGDLTDNGITEYTDIALTFNVYDSEDWTADNVAEETVHVYPCGEENAVKFEREPQATDNVIVDNEYVTVVVTGYEVNEIFGYGVNLFIENKTDKNIMVSADNVSVNGHAADPYYASIVSAGNCKFDFMSWMGGELEDNGITEVEEIEFELSVSDSDDWFADKFASETITLNP